jgi:hypothetical protein
MSNAGGNDEANQRQPVKRVPGAWEGKVWMAPDFDETDPEIIDAMENGPTFPDDTKAGK